MKRVVAVAERFAELDPDQLEVILGKLEERLDGIETYRSNQARKKQGE